MTPTTHTWPLSATRTAPPPARRAPSARVGVLRTRADIREAHLLRGRVFGEHLGWVPVDSVRGDVDTYDERATHLGVFLRHRLVATGRLLRPDDGALMLEHEFSPLLDGPLPERDASVELSRVAIDPTAFRRGCPVRAFVRALLFREFARHTFGLGYRRMLVVIRASHLPCLRARFGFEQVGRAWSFDGSLDVVAAALDIDSLAHRFRWNPLCGLWWLGRQYPEALVRGRCR